MVELSLWRPRTEDACYRVNAHADLLVFVRHGEGTLRSASGDLAFGPNDYVCVPKSVPHRFVFRGACELLHITCHELALPRQFRDALSPLRMDAPYSHRDFRRHVFHGPIDEGSREIVVAHRDARDHVRAPHSPLDMAGWDGTVYPWAFRSSRSSRAWRACTCRRPGTARSRPTAR